MALVNLNHFYYFYEVARHGSFTAAARELMVSQSALSVQVKSLEQEMGGPLLDRRKGGVELTETGELAYTVAERVFQEIDRLMVDLRATDRRFTGTVTIGTVNSIGIYLLPGVLGRFRSAYSDVRVKVDFQEGERVVDLLVQGRVDMVVVPWNRKYAGLSGFRLTTNKMFLVAPAGHDLHTPEQVSPHDLERYPFVGYQEGLVTRALIDSVFKRMSLSIDYAIESANAATIKHMVMAGMGVSILPEYAVADELRRGELIRVNVPAFRLTQEMMVYFRKNRTLSRSQAGFVEFLQEYFNPKSRLR